MAYFRDVALVPARFVSDNPALTTAISRTVSRTSRKNSLSLARSRSSVNFPTDPVVNYLSNSNAANNDDDDTASPSKYDIGWRRVVCHFSPSWFATTMGTGIVSLILICIPFKAHWLYWLSVCFFCLNALLFTLALSISTLRYTLHPEIWTVMIADSTDSLFLGCLPVGFATLVEAWIFLCCPYWGHWSVYVAAAAWMLDCVLAVFVTLSLPFLLMSQSHQHSLDRVTAAQLLPIAATVVAAAAGSEVAEVLQPQDPQWALGTLLASYIMWGIAVPLALTVLVIYYQRLALHKLPPREVIVSSFLPLSSLGMGGYAILSLGKVSRLVFPQVKFFHNLAVAGDIVYITGVFLALIMWGFGLCWLVFALAGMWHLRPFPFNMGWWGFTFPLGAYSISTMAIGVEMPSLFFRVLGTIFGVAVVVLWVVVAAGTARGAYQGHLFYAPCLKNLSKHHDTDGDG
ncbi:hypothetical protein DV736_g2238, partial [Chaetothyriales sp. CBS 134916]